MLIGVIADDFTGASDIANTLTRGLDGEGGLSTAQFLGIPSRPAPAGIDAGVIALKSRSIPAGEAVGQSLRALAWLREQGCRQIVFKYCSTFDSRPEGNIGPVAEALADALGVAGVVACPAFPRAGRTVYQGHLFVHDRLLSESGMEHHPITPMSDPDIRRWLARQCRTPVGHVPLSTVAAGPDAVRAALQAGRAAGLTLMIADAVAESDLVVLGEALADAPLITGGSGIALGLPRNVFRAGLAVPRPAAGFAVGGPSAVLAGSCSGATRTQVDRHLARHPALRIDVADVMAGRLGAADLVEFVRAHPGDVPLVYSSSAPDDVRRLQEQHGRETVSDALDSLFAETARRLVDGGVRRLVVAGGETSGAVVSALDLGALTLGEEIDPGVPILFGQHGGETVALALKSGNFGRPDFFATAIERMGAHA